MIRKLLITAIFCLVALAPAQALQLYSGGPYKRVTITRTIVQKHSRVTYSTTVLVRQTAFWARGRGSDRWTRRHRCATGVRLVPGHVAVDPRRIPYGSKIIFPDGSEGYAVDTGSAVRSRRAARLAGKTSEERKALVVDRFFETRQEAIRWANLHPLFCLVRIILP